MKLNLKNGVLAWVAGILFVLLVLAVSFWSQVSIDDVAQPETFNNQLQTITPLATISEPNAVPVEEVQSTETPVPELTAIPIPTVDPAATKPFVIDVGG